MRLSAPRIPPLAPDSMTDEQRLGHPWILPPTFCELAREGGSPCRKAGRRRLRKQAANRRPERSGTGEAAAEGGRGDA